MRKIYLLDACALIALLKREAGSDKIEELFVEAGKKNCDLLMSKYNLLEVYYGFYRSDGKDVADKRMEAIKATTLQIINTLSDEAFSKAGYLKATYKMSLADSIVLAEGITRNAVIVSSDHHEFDNVEQNEDINFLWVR